MKTKAKKTKEQKKEESLKRLKLKIAEEQKIFQQVKIKKDKIRNQLGRKIKVLGKIHIIVPAERPINFPANYLNYSGWVLSKIE